MWDAGTYRSTTSPFSFSIVKCLGENLVDGSRLRWGIRVMEMLLCVVGLTSR